MKHRTIKEFKDQAKKKNITFWPLHNCSFCAYECGYVIRGDIVYYDIGCFCGTLRPNLEKRSWEEIAHAYDMQTSEKVIEKMDKFWGFE